MRKLRISEDLTLPLAVLQLATVVYGARGSGKTVFGNVLAEEAAKVGVRFCAIDPKGDWYGLKSSADGKSEALPVIIFGGDHQDLPLEDGAGKFLGETVAGVAQSCVLDFEHLSKGKQRRFAADFFEALYHHNREPLIVFIDEAQRFAPQMARGSVDAEAARCLGAVEDAVKLGRKHGLGIVLFTQRGSGLNKEVSELCDLLVAFRTPGPLDQERVKDWLDANTTKAQRDEVMGQLAGLPTGTAVFASGHPDLKLFGAHAVRMRETFDSSATPKIGQQRREPKKLAKPDLEELRAKMADSIERAKADDPKALRARIAVLEKENAKLARLPAKTAAPQIHREIVERLVFDDEAFRRLHETMHTILGGIEVAAREGKRSLGQALNGYRDACRKAIAESKKNGKAAFPAPSAADTKALSYAFRLPLKENLNAAMRPSSGTPNGDASLGNSGLRRMLIALAQRPQGLDRRQLALRSGMKQSGTFDTYIGRARSNGWIDGRGHMKITPDGLAALGSYDPLPEGAELLEYWLRELGGGAERMLRALADAYPNDLSREELAQAAGMQLSGTFDTYVGKLRGFELLEGRGRMRASAEFFD